MDVGKLSAVSHVHGRLERRKALVAFDPYMTDIALRIRTGINNFTWHVSSFNFATRLDLTRAIDDCLQRESKPASWRFRNMAGADLSCWAEGIGHVLM